MSCQVTPLTKRSPFFGERGDFGVVQYRRALIRRGSDQVYEEPTIVKLTVIIDNASGESVGIYIGKFPQRFLLGNLAGFSKTVFAREQLVDFEANSVERTFPPGIAGHNASQLIDQMRRVLPQKAAFLQSFHHERDIALFEISHSAMHELGAAAGSAFAEIMLFQQERRITSRGGVDRHARAGGSAANDDDVPRLDPLACLPEHFLSLHGISGFVFLRNLFFAAFLFGGMRRSVHGSQSLARESAVFQRGTQFVTPVAEAFSVQTLSPPAIASQYC